MKRSTMKKTPVADVSKLSPADDEYTPAQRRKIDARLAKALAEVKAGRVRGPFNSADEMIADMKARLKER